MGKKIVFVSKSDKFGYPILFRNKVSIKLNNKFVTYVFNRDALYYLTPRNTIACVENNVNDNVVPTKIKRDDIVPTYL